MVGFVNDNSQEVLPEYGARSGFLGYNGRDQPRPGVLTWWVVVELLEIRKYNLERAVRVGLLRRNDTY
jgi:hypothetical protein